MGLLLWPDLHVPLSQEAASLIRAWMQQPSQQHRPSSRLLVWDEGLKLGGMSPGVCYSLHPDAHHCEEPNLTVGSSVFFRDTKKPLSCGSPNR